MNSRQRRTLEAIFSRPTLATIVWTDIESLLRALGANVSQGRGSRVRVELNGVRAVFHEPHPEKDGEGCGRGRARFLSSGGGYAMSTVLMYKGYTGRVEIDFDAGVLFGRVLDITEVITFRGTTVEEARQAFTDSIDDYLAYCEELGQQPDRPFSGKILFRTTPERHRRIFVAARQAGKSINAWMDEVLSEAAENAITDRPHATLPLSSEALGRR